MFAHRRLAPCWWVDRGMKIICCSGFGILEGGEAGEGGGRLQRQRDGRWMKSNWKPDLTISMQSLQRSQLPSVWASLHPFLSFSLLSPPYSSSLSPFPLSASLHLQSLSLFVQISFSSLSLSPSPVSSQICTLPLRAATLQLFSFSFLITWRLTLCVHIYKDWGRFPETVVS